MDEKYPEHAKFEEVKDQILGAEQFCEHLRDRGYMIGCYCGSPTFSPVGHPVAGRASIYRFFGVDYDRLMREKEAMLAVVRSGPLDVHDIPLDTPIEPSTPYAEGELPPAEKRLSTIEYCARCGGNHVGLRFKRILNPIEDCDQIVWNWFAICPATGDPILLRIFTDVAKNNEG
jgi:hypothetical protein